MRVLLAIILTLGAVVAMGVGVAEVFGWTNTVVSALVPLTVMVTTTATLVYLHSRFMEPDDAPTLLEHHARALANKFLPEHRLHVRDGGWLRGARGFGNPPRTRDGHMDRPAG